MEPEPTRPRPNQARGIALIASALIVGIFVMRAGFDVDGDGSETVANPPGATTETTAADDGGEETTTTEPVRPPGEITVIVANASGVNGAAGNLTATLADAGYLTAPQTDAPERLETTQVLFAPGFDREAAAVAQAIGVAAEAATALPEPPPVELAGAQILVLLGPDIAA